MKFIKFIISSIILVNGALIPKGDICAHLLLPELSLIFCHPSRSLNISIYTGGNILHCFSGTPGFGNGCLHICRLASGNFIHFFNSVFESAGLEAEYNELDEPNDADDARKAHHPSVGARFISFLCLYLGGFGLSLLGWQCPNHQRRLLSATLIGGGLLLSGLGLLEWLCWDWLI